jgi:hypothetical protein
METEKQNTKRENSVPQRAEDILEGKDGFFVKRRDEGEDVERNELVSFGSQGAQASHVALDIGHIVVDGVGDVLQA